MKCLIENCLIYFFARFFDIAIDKLSGSRSSWLETQYKDTNMNILLLRRKSWFCDTNWFGFFDLSHRWFSYEVYYFELEWFIVNLCAINAIKEEGDGNFYVVANFKFRFGQNLESLHSYDSVKKFSLNVLKDPVNLNKRQRWVNNSICTTSSTAHLLSLSWYFLHLSKFIENYTNVQAEINSKREMFAYQINNGIF